MIAFGALTVVTVHDGAVTIQHFWFLLFAAMLIFRGSL